VDGCSETWWTPRQGRGGACGLEGTVNHVVAERIRGTGAARRSEPPRTHAAVRDQPDRGYRLLTRYGAEGEAGLANRSRRPHRSPRRTAATLEAEVLALRDAHPAWGGRRGGPGCRPSAMPRCRRRARSRRSCVGMGARWGPCRLRRGRGAALRPRSPMRYGRWTSRATSPSGAGAVMR